ncbi:MAG TPA: flagellar hook-basal body complex protein FliE [Ruminococcaceae bacterium]|jgi:flagellar hook-basal body complex protein FliE|nr:flagellar hook-basal body complex protein FliE [Oscillospiraceae bacterium]
MPVSALNGANLTELNSIINKSEKADDFYIPFKDVFANAIDNVNSTQRIAEQDLLNVLSGQTDDLHTVMINSVKADLALQTLVQLRNKALDSYNEIMRISL